GSGIGRLITPQEIFVEPEQWRAMVRSRSGASLEQLGLSGDTAADEDVPFVSQPTSRFHGSVPAMIEEVKKLNADGRRVVFAASNMGEVERLADIFSGYGVP